MCSAAKNKCILIFLYCPLTQWGKIKKSESNDGKANSELFETGAWEGMVADNFAKKRETKARALMEPHISNMLQHDQKLLLRIHVPQHVGVSKYMPNKILNLGGDSGRFWVIRGMLGVIRVIREAWNAYVCNVCLGTTEVFYNIRKG